jgi:hypothetical protein
MSDASSARPGTVEEACALLGHRHRLGDERCVCGLIPAYAPDGTEVRKAEDAYLELAADAYCAEHEHTGPGGTTGYSWRDGTCCCVYDVRAVLRAVGQVAGHVECREMIDRSERHKSAAWDEVDRLRAAILRHRALVRNGPAWSAANRELWSAVDGGA